jgi:hypothetical protein
VRITFQVVIEWRERDIQAIFSAEREADQVIRERRVLWQERTMQIAAKGIPRHCALSAVLAIVAVPDHDLPEWPRPAPRNVRPL